MSQPVPGACADTFSHLLLQRKSVRAFTPQSVPDALLLRLMEAARRAPSGANLQPGTFVQVRGDVRAALTASLLQAVQSGQAQQEDYSYFPEPMPGHLRRRQVAAARALYDALAIARDDRAGRDAQFARNFGFFDAPVAVVVTIDSAFGSGGYMDLGMALYGFMLAAQAQGLASCAIGALASYPALVRASLGLGDDSHIVCGLALGYEDGTAAVNQTRTNRCELEAFFKVLG
jgi:nitroreductase